MPDRVPIEIDRLVLPAFRAWHRDGFLLAAGDFAAGQWNCMTVGWGGLGCLWDRPVAVVGARPSRYTVEFLRRHPGFTLCHFPAGHRKALVHLGTHSGRDGDKVAASGLTPVASTVVAAPSFAEADLVIECVQLYAQDYSPEAALDERLRGDARSGRAHTLFFGEVRAVLGVPGYAAAG